MVRAVVYHAGALVKMVTLPPITMEQRNYETTKYETAKQQKYETTKVRNNERAKVRNNDSTKQRK